MTLIIATEHNAQFLANLPAVDDTGNTIVDYLSAVSLLVNSVHQHDSRPGGYCVSVRYNPGQSVHVLHDGHALNETDFTIYNARSGFDAPMFSARSPIQAQQLAYDLTDHTERAKRYADYRTGVRRQLAIIQALSPSSPWTKIEGPF